MERHFRGFGVAAEFCSIGQMVRLAQSAEQEGFGRFWIGEDCYWRGAFSVAATIAARTQHLGVGLGVINPYTRHPVLAAMETAALAEAAGTERVTLGIGASLRRWVEDQMGMHFGKPRRALKEAVDIIRAMFTGDAVHFDGECFKVRGARLSMSPVPPIPQIYLGVEGPKNLELAGEIADGVLLSVFSSPAYLRFALEHIRMGAARRGPGCTDSLDIQNYIVISMDTDGRAARDAIRPFIGRAIAAYAPVLPETDPVLSSVLTPDHKTAIVEAHQRGEDVGPLISDAVVDGFAVAGTPEECQERLQAILDIGVTTPVAMEAPGIDLAAMLPEIRQFLFPDALARGHY